MDNSCIRRSRLIKQFHFVVWTVLLLAVGVLGRRVYSERNSELPQTVAQVTEVPPAGEVSEDGQLPVRIREDEIVARPQRIKRSAKQSERPVINVEPPVESTVLVESDDEERPTVLELSGETELESQSAETEETPVATLAGPPATVEVPPVVALGPEQPVVSAVPERVATETIEVGVVQSGPAVPVSSAVVDKAPAVEQPAVGQEGPSLPRSTEVKRVAPQEVQRVTPKAIVEAPQNNEAQVVTKLPIKNSLPPFKKTMLKIENPKKIGYPVAFLFGSEQLQLQPGETFVRNLIEQKGEVPIQFDRGGDFGEASLNLKPGEYEFTVTRKGWNIVPSKPATNFKQ